MYKVTVRKLIRGHAEVHIDDIIAALEAHKNLFIEYIDDLGVSQGVMEVGWEDLASHFNVCHKDLFKENPLFGFKFVPNILTK